MAVQFENLDKLNADLKRIAADFGGQTALLVQKKVALTFLKSVVNRTPVDTGRARGNWQATIGVPASVEIANVDGNAAIQRGSVVILGVSIPYQVLWVSNNVPYIGYLEEGSSDQAPNGMVDGALIDAGVVVIA